MIFSEGYIKKPLPPKYFTIKDDFLLYINQYHEYKRKCLIDVPAIRISRQNYEEIKKQWREIYKLRNPKYLIFREHDNSYVDILEKDDFSEEYLMVINREKNLQKIIFSENMIMIESIYI